MIAKDSYRKSRVPRVRKVDISNPRERVSQFEYAFSVPRKFESQAGQFLHSVANGSPPLQQLRK